MTEQMGEVTSDDRLWAAIAYFLAPLTPILILLMADKKDRPFIKAHNMQALIAGIVAVVVLPILATFTFGCGGLLGLIFWYWAYQAYQGKMITIPFITNFVKSQGWA